MKIEQFVEEFSKAQNKEEYVKKHIVNEYISYTQKVTICRSIADYTSHKEVLGKKVYSIDSSMRYMLFVFSIIEQYTDIELGQNDERIKAFDLIEKYNVMYFITTCMGDEYKRLDTVLKMQVDDIYSNERDLPSFLENKMEALSLVMERVDKINEQKNKQYVGSENKGD